MCNVVDAAKWDVAMPHVKERQMVKNDVLAAYRHDRSFFVRLHHDNHMIIRAYLMRQAHGLDANDLDDMVQEVFVRAWRMRNHFRGGASLRTFLIAIARNVLREYFAQRRRRAAGTLPQGLAEQERRSGMHDVEQRDLVARLQRVIAELSPLQRAAIEMICVEGLTPAEAARQCNTTVKAMRRRIENARTRLLALLSVCNGACDVRKGGPCAHTDSPDVRCPLRQFLDVG